jgi:hypothetical protein
MANQQKAIQEAAKVAPWWGKEGTPEDTEARAILQKWPNLLNIPEGPMTLVDLVAGKMARKGQTATPAKPAPPPKLPQPKAATPATPDAKTAAAAARRNKVIEKGEINETDAAELLAHSGFLS